MLNTKNKTKSNKTKERIALPEYNLSNYVLNNRLSIIVKPNSKKTEILGYDETKKAVKIAIAAEPENNKANKELIRFVSKQLKKKVLVERGLTSKEKILIITD